MCFRWDVHRRLSEEVSFVSRLEWSKGVNRTVGGRASQADRTAGAKALGWDHLSTLGNNVVMTQWAKDNSEIRGSKRPRSRSTYLSKIRMYWIVLHWLLTWSDNVFKVSFYTENRLVVAKREGNRGGVWGSLGLADANYCT